MKNSSIILLLTLGLLPACQATDTLSPAEYPDASSHTRESLQELPFGELEEGEGELIDVDGDGLPDGIDTDGDGMLDLTFDTPSNQETDDTIDSPPGQPPADNSGDDTDGIDSEQHEQENPSEDPIDSSDPEGDDTPQDPITDVLPPPDGWDAGGETPDDASGETSEVGTPDTDSPSSSDPQPAGNPCALTLSTRFIHTTSSRTIGPSDVAGYQNLIVSVSSTDGMVVVDLEGQSIDRVIIVHAGSRNSVRIRNTAALIGFCSGRLSGSTNTQVLEDTSSAPIVELLTAQGNSNNLDIAFSPGVGTRYTFSGSNHCLSAPPGSAVLSAASNNDSHRVYLDGNRCSPH